MWLQRAWLGALLLCWRRAPPACADHAARAAPPPAGTGPPPWPAQRRPAAATTSGRSTAPLDPGPVIPSLRIRHARPARALLGDQRRKAARLARLSEGSHLAGERPLRRFQIRRRSRRPAPRHGRRRSRRRARRQRHRRPLGRASPSTHRRPDGRRDRLLAAGEIGHVLLIRLQPPALCAGQSGPDRRPLRLPPGHLRRSARKEAISISCDTSASLDAFQVGSARAGRRTTAGSNAPEFCRCSVTCFCSCPRRRGLEHQGAHPAHAHRRRAARLTILDTRRHARKWLRQRCERLDMEAERQWFMTQRRGIVQASFQRIPDGKGKHPAEMMDAVITVFFIEVENRFCIAARGIAVTATFQIRADRCVIIDFTVEDNPNGSILVRHWLVAAAQIHDAQAPEP